MITKNAFVLPPLGPHIDSPLTRAEIDDIERRRAWMAQRCGKDFANRWADTLSHSWRLRVIYNLGGRR